MSTTEPQPTPERDAIPERIDHYRIIRRIGRGGQGDVYLAHDPHLDIEVAIKVLLADLRADEWMDRFKVEARTAVRLTAPNIVRVYNFDPRHPYLAMEYCGGGDLNQLIKQRIPLPLPTSVGLVRQVLQALVVAHRHDPPILHRDLKPVNVLFSDGVPKVADFGLAKITGSAAGLTATRGMMGTVAYCSPEQLKDASRVDHRTDLWSVGVMLYELLTFRRPFDKSGDDYVNVAIKVRMEPPAPPPFELPAPLWAVIDRALRKDPDERFAGAEEMIEALDAALAAIPDADTLELPPASTLSEVERMAGDVGRLLDTGATSAAAMRLRDMHGVAPDASIVRYWRRRVREQRQVDAVSGSGLLIDSTERRRADWLEGRLNSIRSLITDQRFSEARRRVGELLVEDPDNSVVQNYLMRINDEERAVSSPPDPSPPVAPAPPVVAPPVPRSPAPRGSSDSAVAPLRAPARPWLPWVVCSAVGVFLLAGAFVAFAPRGAAAVPVTLISERGAVHVSEILRDGEPWAAPHEARLDVSEEGVRWALAPGRYALRTDGGAQVGFTVPRADVVVLPAGDPGAVDVALRRALGLTSPPPTGSAGGAEDGR